MSVKYRPSVCRVAVKYRRVSPDMRVDRQSADISTESRPTYRPSISRYIDRLSVDISADCRSTYRPRVSTDTRSTVKIMREPLPSTSQDYSSLEISCHSRVPPCNCASALAPRSPLFPSKIALFLFSLLMTTAQKRACRKRDQNYSFPAKLLFAYCERRGFRYFIG